MKADGSSSLPVLSGALAGPVIRVVEDATEWQFLFYRSLGVFLGLGFLMHLKSGNLIQTMKDAGKTSVFGGSCLLTGFVSPAITP